VRDLASVPGKKRKKVGITREVEPHLLSSLLRPLSTESDG